MNLYNDRLLSIPMGEDKYMYKFTRQILSLQQGKAETYFRLFLLPEL